jgi:ketosteroid isomerase-like protein
VVTLRDPAVAAEVVVAADGMAFIDRLWRDWSLATTRPMLRPAEPGLKSPQSIRKDVLMPDLAAELAAFMTGYEEANNSHDIDRVVPMIAEDATYWFSDGSYQGIEEIAGAIERTFQAIGDEVYRITDLEWVVLSAEHAVCRYRFWWTGVIDGRPGSGRGRGTNVVVKRAGAWKMQHEHLSS